MKKIWDISKLVALIVVIAWGVAFAGQVKKNTTHRLTQKYFQTRDWIKDMTRDCGEDAKDCNEAKQKRMEIWKLEADKLEQKIFK